MERDGPGDRIDTVTAERDGYRALADERERMIAAHEATIRDLRTRLDRETEERRHLIALLTGPRVPWWRRWFR